MGALSKICNKTGIKQWTSNKKSQMSPKSLANTGFTNLKSVHLDHKKQIPFWVSAFYYLYKTGLEPEKVLALIKQSSGLFLAKSGEVGTVALATVTEPLVCKAKP